MINYGLEIALAKGSLYELEFIARAEALCENVETIAYTEFVTKYSRQIESELGNNDKLNSLLNEALARAYGPEVLLTTIMNQIEDSKWYESFIITDVPADIMSKMNDLKLYTIIIDPTIRTHETSSLDYVISDTSAFDEVIQLCCQTMTADEYHLMTVNESISALRSPFGGM